MVLFRTVALLLFAVVVTGCAPTLQPEDLGTVENKVPKLPGAEIPFPMPELEAPAEPPSAKDSTGTEADAPAGEKAGEPASEPQN